MPRWQAIDKHRHRTAGWLRPRNYLFAQRDGTAPLLVSELAQALPCYPIAFAPTQNNPATFQLVVVQSLQNGSNAYLDLAGHWQSAYIPAYYRGYPFRVIPAENSRFVLCVDTTASSLFHENALPGDLALFVDGEQFSADFQPVADFLQQCAADQVQTDQLVAELAEAGLIEPWPITLKLANQPQMPLQAVQGLYHINEARLKALSVAHLQRLTVSGALALAYAQLFSKARLPELAQRSGQRKTPAPIQFGAGNGKLDYRFSLGNDGNIQF